MLPPLAIVVVSLKLKSIVTNLNHSNTLTREDYPHLSKKPFAGWNPTNHPFTGLVDLSSISCILNIITVQWLSLLLPFLAWISSSALYCLSWTIIVLKVYNWKVGQRQNYFSSSKNSNIRQNMIFNKSQQPRTGKHQNFIQVRSMLSRIPSFYSATVSRLGARPTKCSRLVITILWKGGWGWPIYKKQNRTART